MPLPAAVLIGIAVALGLFLLGWRWASRRWQLPCPTLLAWALESPLYGRFTGTQATLSRMALRPGWRVLEIGPGPGRLLIPVARQIRPDGEAVGIDIQPGMIDRLMQRSADAGLTNLTAILGDATQPVVPESSFDLVFVVTTLGEIPDRSAVLAQCFRALKPGGILSITEMLPDPHYQTRATVKRLAIAAGFELQSLQGHWWFYTANFQKPGLPPARTDNATDAVA